MSHDFVPPDQVTQTAQAMTVFSGSTWFEISHNKKTGIEFYRRGRVIDAAWYAPDGQLWSLSVAREAFVEWVRHGFKVACQDCWESALPKSSQQCSHVTFAGDRKKAKHMVKVMEMDLI